MQDLEDRFDHLKKEYEDEDEYEDIAQLVEDFEQMREIHEEYVNVSYDYETFYDLWVKYFDDEEIDLGRIVRQVSIYRFWDFSLPMMTPACWKNKRREWKRWFC